MKRVHSFHRIVIIAVAMALAGGVPAQADDVEDQVKEAMQAYRDKDYQMAASGLETAAQLIRQKRGEGFTQLFPAAPAGWRAEEAQSMAAGAAMFGGGITASRDYRKGNATVSIQYITDSPMLQSFMMMLNMPMMAGASGAKIERIKGQRAIVNLEDLTINIVVGGAMLVSIDGSDCTIEDVRLFAEAIDYSALAAKL